MSSSGAPSSAAYAKTVGGKLQLKGGLSLKCVLSVPLSLAPHCLLCF